MRGGIVAFECITFAVFVVRILFLWSKVGVIRVRKISRIHTVHTCICVCIKSKPYLVEVQVWSVTSSEVRCLELFK